MARCRWVSVVGFSLALAFLVCPLEAQERKGQGRPGGGFGGGGFDSGVTRLALLRVEPVQTELKLAQDQKDKLSELQASLRDQSGFGNLRDVPQEEREKRFAEAREKREKAVAEAEKKLADILKPEQTKRLGEIFVQHSGALAFKDATVAKELKLNEEQLGKVNAAIQWGQEEERKLTPNRGEGAGGGGRDPAAATERQEKREKVQAETSTKALAALTDSQKEQFEKMKGTGFKLDRNALRGGGGRGQRGPGGKAENKDGEKGKGGSDKADAKI